MMIENTTFSGVGKPEYDSFVPYSDQEFYDHKGRKVFPGDEYYSFDTQTEEMVLVHIEEVAEYLNDDRLATNDYEQLIHLIGIYYDNYPVTM